MTYLLAKYALLFLFTTALGFLLGYWWSRRNFVDVSESYADLRKANLRSDKHYWDRLWKRLDAMPEPRETDLSGIENRLNAMLKIIENLPKPEPVKFDSIEHRLDSIGQTIVSLPKPEAPKDPDFRPVVDRLDRIDADIRAMPQPEKPQHVDLEPVDRRLQAIETEISQLGKRLVQRKPSPTPQRQSQPRILKAALYGEKDDLQRISGVGPKLEKLLNKNGVYYFWQVASWTSQDIEIIDDRLDVFRGRISRDEWVKQAERLRQQPGAATMPG